MSQAKACLLSHGGQLLPKRERSRWESGISCISGAVSVWGHGTQPRSMVHYGQIETKKGLRHSMIATKPEDGAQPHSTIVTKGLRHIRTRTGTLNGMAWFYRAWLMRLLSLLK